MSGLPAPDLAALVGQSQARPVVLVLSALAGGGYLLAVSWPGRSGPRWPWWRTASFFAGLAVVLVATCSGIEAYGRVLQWVHMVEHLLLIMVAPVLLAVGSPVQLLHDRLPAKAARPVDRVLGRPLVGWSTSPVTAALGYAVAVVGVHLTGLLTRVVSGPNLHGTEELVYLASGYLLFQLVFGVHPGPSQLTPLGKLALLAFVSPVDTVVGVVLLQSGTVQSGLAAGHGAHSGVTRPDWALPPAADTIAAGTTMWIGGTGIMALLMIAVGLAWLHGRPPAATRPGWTDRARSQAFTDRTGAPPGADVDSDEALRAYNDYLGRLAVPERRPDD
ncbi:MAG: cytochrome c oxidase assembly protein [Mycobacteriales bacterium]